MIMLELNTWIDLAVCGLTLFFCTMAAIFMLRSAKYADLLKVQTEGYQALERKLSMLEIDVNEKLNALIARVSARSAQRKDANESKGLNGKIGGIIGHGPPIIPQQHSNASFELGEKRS